MRIGCRERGKPDQEEDRRGVYRNGGWERISVCGIGIKAEAIERRMASAFLNYQKI